MGTQVALSSPSAPAPRAAQQRPPASGRRGGAPRLGGAACVRAGGGRGEGRASTKSWAPHRLVGRGRHLDGPAAAAARRQVAGGQQRARQGAQALPRRHRVGCASGSVAASLLACAGSLGRLLQAGLESSGLVPLWVRGMRGSGGRAVARQYTWPRNRQTRPEPLDARRGLARQYTSSRTGGNSPELQKQTARPASADADSLPGPATGSVSAAESPA